MLLLTHNSALLVKNKMTNTILILVQIQTPPDSVAVGGFRCRRWVFGTRFVFTNAAPDRPTLGAVAITRSLAFTVIGKGIQTVKLSKKTVAAGVLVLLTLAMAGAQKLNASPIASPLPCPEDMTLPGSICTINGVKPIAGDIQKPARRRIFLPWVPVQ